MIPVFEEFSKEYGDKITFAHLNIEYYPDVYEKYSRLGWITGKPTFLLFNNGNPTDSVVGAYEESLESMIRKYQ